MSYDPLDSHESLQRFIGEYEKVAGEWNDEAGTKVYALEMLLQTIKQAGAKAIDDVGAFKGVMPEVVGLNPFISDETIKLGWIGERDFQQKRQIRVPMVVTEYQDPDFKTLFIGTVE